MQSFIALIAEFTVVGGVIWQFIPSSQFIQQYINSGVETPYKEL